MKQQLQNLSIYQAGKTAEDLKRDYQIEREMLKLSSNESVYGPSPKVKAAITAAIDHLEEYPDSTGYQLKTQLANYYKVSKDSILIGAGLDEVIMMLSRAILRPGDHILTSEQTFIQYQHHAIIESCQVDTVALQEGKFDLAALADAITDQTALIWLCNPNNPTGHYFSETELIALLDKSKEIPVVLDEAYAEFVTAADYPDSFKLRDRYPNLIILRTFSKAYGLASMRIGYAISSEEWTTIWHKVKLPFNVTTLSLAAAEAAINDQQYISKVRTLNHTERQRYFDSAIGHLLVPSQTNFVLVRCSDSQALNDHLLKDGIIARPMPGGVRITIGTTAQNDIVIHSLEQFFKEGDIS